MDVKVGLRLNHGYLFDPPHICTLPLRGGSGGRGDEQRGVLLSSSPHVDVGVVEGWGVGLYMLLITAPCSHGCSRYVFSYGSKIVCAQRQDGQWDFFFTHPVYSSMFTQDCLMNLNLNDLSTIRALLYRGK